VYHIIPYLGLIIIFVPLVIWVLVRKKKPGLFTVFFTYIGMIYVVEFFVLVVFDSYQYKPMVLSVPYYDNILGAVISDMVAVPAVAFVVAVFRLNKIWCAVLGGVFGGIEWVFVKLHVYEPHWWSIPHTIIAFTVFFLLARLWLRKLQEFYHPVMHFLSLFLPTFVLVATILFVSGIFNLHIDHIGVFLDKYRDSVFVASIYGAVESLVFVAAQFYFHKNLWWNLSAVAYSIVFEYALERTGVIHVLVQSWVYYGVQFCCSILVAFALFYMNRWIIRIMPLEGTYTSHKSSV
jgi:hypothetical protein